MWFTNLSEDKLNPLRPELCFKILGSPWFTLQQNIVLLKHQPSKVQSRHKLNICATVLDQPLKESFCKCHNSISTPIGMIVYWSKLLEKKKKLIQKLWMYQKFIYVSEFHMAAMPMQCRSSVNCFPLQSCGVLVPKPALGLDLFLKDCWIFKLVSHFHYYCLVFQAVLWRWAELGWLCHHCAVGTATSLWPFWFLLSPSQSPKTGRQGWNHQKCGRCAVCTIFFNHTHKQTHLYYQ